MLGHRAFDDGARVRGAGVIRQTLRLFCRGLRREGDIQMGGNGAEEAAPGRGSQTSHPERRPGASGLGHAQDMGAAAR